MSETIARYEISSAEYNVLLHRLEREYGKLDPTGAIVHGIPVTRGTSVAENAHHVVGADGSAIVVPVALSELTTIGFLAKNGLQFDLDPRVSWKVT